MAKRTHASVTEVPCTCNALQFSADQKHSPVTFDESLNEYHFVYPDPTGKGNGSLMIYHCFFCGGTAPESKRKRQFAVIDFGEKVRLDKLVKDIKTINDAISVLGEPDRDEITGEHIDEENNTPPIVNNYRSLVYTKISQTANIRITDRHKEVVSISYSGKYIGPKNKED